jgi:hypothetical protein
LQVGVHLSGIAGRVTHFGLRFGPILFVLAPLVALVG